MDECIGSLMPLYIFVTEMPKLIKHEGKYSVPFVMFHFIKTLFQSESSRRTWVLRSAMFPVLQGVYNAYEQKKIQGAFIFSNNGSQELVDFVGMFLNACMWNMFDIYNTRPVIFQMACCSQSPERKEFPQYIKNYDSIQHSLLYNGLPPCSSKEDLLFFDDLVHELEQEIPNYVQVPAYLHHTEIHSFLQALAPLSQFFEPQHWAYLLVKSREYYYSDMSRPDNRYKPYLQTVEESTRDTLIFLKGLQVFMYPKTK